MVQLLGLSEEQVQTIEQLMGERARAMTRGGEQEHSGVTRRHVGEEAAGGVD